MNTQPKPLKLLIYNAAEMTSGIKFPFFLGLLYFLALVFILVLFAGFISPHAFETGQISGGLLSHAVIFILEGLILTLSSQVFIKIASARYKHFIANKENRTPLPELSHFFKPDSKTLELFLGLLISMIVWAVVITFIPLLITWGLAACSELFSHAQSISTFHMITGVYLASLLILYLFMNICLVFTPFAIQESKVSYLTAFYKVFLIFKPYKLKLIGISLGLLVLNIIGGLLIGIGLIWTLPFTYSIYAQLYFEIISK